MAGSRLICPQCRRYTAGAPACSRCGAATAGPTVPGAPTGRGRPLTQGIGRSPHNGAINSGGIGANQGGPTGAGWLTGQVIREQEIQTGRAGGTGPLLALGIAVPLLLTVLIDGTSMVGAINSIIFAIAGPFIVLMLLIVFLTRGRFGFGLLRGGMALGRAASSRTRRSGGGRLGRSLIVRCPGRDRRVIVARDIDIPLGGTVQVRGPNLGGHTHAWQVRVAGLDTQAFITRGVVGGLLGIFIGSAISLVLVIAAVTG